jgi:uncharacterized protein
MLVIRRLVWDNWNVAHVARHEITPEEVEEVCHSEPVVQIGKKGRSLVFGPTLSGRMLAVVLDLELPEEGVYYPVTARPASRRERAIYTTERGGENR